MAWREWPAIAQSNYRRDHDCPRAASASASDSQKHKQPAMAVLPSPDTATDMPCWAFPTAPVPISFDPCCVNCPCDPCCCPGASCNENRMAAKIPTDAPNNLDDLRCEIGQIRAVILAPLLHLEFHAATQLGPNLAQEYLNAQSVLAPAACPSVPRCPRVRINW
jgi:hypothetical protein